MPDAKTDPTAPAETADVTAQPEAAATAPETAPAPAEVQPEAEIPAPVVDEAAAETEADPLDPFAVIIRDTIQHDPRGPNGLDAGSLTRAAAAIRASL